MTRRTRRRILATIGVVGIGGVAGCNTLDKETPANGTESEPPAQPSDTDTATRTVTQTTTLATHSTTTTVPAPTTIESGRKFAAEDGDRDDSFGNAVSLSSDGTTALVGAWADEDPNGRYTGAAYVFERSSTGWEQRVKLSPREGLSDTVFGTDVALSADGRIALVGASREDTPNGENAGAVYVFEHQSGGWKRRTKLIPEDGGADYHFGGSVSLAADGRSALVGAVHDGTNGSSAGAAYVYEDTNQGWRRQTKLLPDDVVSDTWFGFATALSGDGSAALVSTPNDDAIGAAYAFHRTGGEWSLQTKFTPDDGNRYEQFGWSVALSHDGSTALVGSPRDHTPNGENIGSVVVYERAGGRWRRQAKLYTQNGERDDSFGGAVALSRDGESALVGSPDDDATYGYRSGSAHVFERSGDAWHPRFTLLSSDSTDDDEFGDTVSLSHDGSVALIGARNHEQPNGEEAGATYVYDL